MLLSLFVLYTKGDPTIGCMKSLQGIHKLNDNNNNVAVFNSNLFCRTPFQLPPSLLRASVRAMASPSCVIPQVESVVGAVETRVATSANLAVR